MNKFKIFDELINELRIMKKQIPNQGVNRLLNIALNYYSFGDYNVRSDEHCLEAVKKYNLHHMNVK